MINESIENYKLALQITVQNIFWKVSDYSKKDSFSSRSLTPCFHVMFSHDTCIIICTKHRCKPLRGVSQNKYFTTMVKSLKNTCKSVPFLVNFNIKLTLLWIFFKDLFADLL